MSYLYLFLKYLPFYVKFDICYIRKGFFLGFCFKVGSYSGCKIMIRGGQKLTTKNLERKQKVKFFYIKPIFIILLSLKLVQVCTKLLI